MAWFIMKTFVQVVDYHDFFVIKFPKRQVALAKRQCRVRHIPMDAVTKRTLLRFYCPVIRSLYTCARSVFARATSTRGSVALEIRPDREGTRDTEREKER